PLSRPSSSPPRILPLLLPYHTPLLPSLQSSQIPKPKPIFPVGKFPNPRRHRSPNPRSLAAMMFTEGLDESAISWIKQGTDTPPAAARSPLAERLPLGQISADAAAPRSPALYNRACVGLFSPKSLPPPVRTATRHSGLLGRHSVLLAADSEEEEEGEESVASWGLTEDCGYGYFSDHTAEEDGVCSSDSSLFRRARDLYGNGVEDEVTSQFSRRGGGLARGQSKENLRVEVRAAAAAAFAGKSSRGQDQVDRTSHERYADVQKFQDFGPPSAPPIAARVGEVDGILDAIADESGGFEKTEISSVADILAQDVHELPTRSTAQADGVQMPYIENNLLAQIPSFTTNVQNAWQSFVAYDACFRLCLNAWAKNCMEAPEFLRDECMVLRSAFGIQKFLLHPKHKNQDDGKHTYDKDESCSMKTRKLVKRIEIEVRKIRVVPQRPKLRVTSSFRNLYMQAGSEYVRQISKILKSQVTMLTSTSSTSLPEEMFTCTLELKSSLKGQQRDSISLQYLKPGTGESQLFYLEGQGDVILVEVQDNNRVVIGRAEIQVSSFSDAHEEFTRWWPLYLEDQECVGKIQLCLNLSMPADNYGSAKMLQGGLAVDTIIYDMVLEAAMRAQNFNSKMLHISGSWKWLLDEFSDYYGLSDAYRKLRYLCYIMNVATPTKDCLELTYELLLPVIKARDDRTLTRQERSILLDCEDRINVLLAIVFENYKSLDEHSITGLSELFGPISDCAAPALAPAVQIFSVLHDILSNEAQSILRSYLQAAAAKRCRRHMIETDEFMSSNNDNLLTDDMTISAAYLKMKTLCINISLEIQADIKIHDQNILPSSIDLPNIAASLYSTELCKRLKGFLSASPPSRPLQHVAELLIATANFERDLDSWQVRPVHGGVLSRELFHDYIMVWIEDTRLHLLDYCKAEKLSYPAASTTSPFVEQIYEQIRESINEYGVVINRWPQYLMSLESAIADVEREVMKALEKQYMETLMPLRDGIPKILEKHVQRLTRRQSVAPYVVPNQLGTFMNTVKRMLDVLHCRVEDILKSWASYLTIANGTTLFGEQMNSITVMLRKKYKKYLQAIVEKIVSETQANRTTRLKRILEETKETEGESEMRERMQALRAQLSDSIHNLHGVFSCRIFVAICRGFWDRLGQVNTRRKNLSKCCHDNLCLLY
uniref:MHD1 domain-containing protein n=3 Tax=Aegilops tauschii subsp. strangulata TaxID=200361 RepID=A0A453NM32_AEGTS